MVRAATRVPRLVRVSENKYFRSLEVFLPTNYFPCCPTTTLVLFVCKMFIFSMINDYKIYL